MTTDLDRYRNGINALSELLKVASELAPTLLIGDKISSYHLILAIMNVESSLGVNNLPRFELGYSRCSLAYRKSSLLQDGYRLYGDLCAMSYGPMQIMYIVARELGFGGNPLALWDGAVSLPYAILLLRKNYVAGADTVEKLAATYNAGIGALKGKNIWPSAYVNSVVLSYQLMQKKFPLSSAPSA